MSQTTLYDLKGSPVPLESLWAEGPAVLAFLRHFG
jgi:hypothetical protein